MNEDMIREIAEVSQLCKNNANQIEDVKDSIKGIVAENKAIYELTTSVKLIAQDMGFIKEGLEDVKQGQGELSKKVGELENKPYKFTSEKWDKIKMAVYIAITTFIAMNIVEAIAKL